jgi:hypothetical protein
MKGYVPTLMALIVAVAPSGPLRADPAQPGSPKVTLSLDQQDLREGIPLLGEAVGRKMKAGPNVRNRRIFLFVRDRPLQDVMDRLRGFVPERPGTCMWSKSGETTVFEEDLLSVETRAKRVRERKRFARSHRVEGLARAGHWAAEPAGTEYATKTTRLELQYFQGIFFGLPGTEREKTLSGQQVRVPFSALSPDAQRRAYLLIRGYGTSTEGHPEKTWEGARDYKTLTVEVRPAGLPDQPGLGIGLAASVGGGVSFSDIAHPPSRNPDGGWDWPWQRRRHNEKVRRPAGLEKDPRLQVRISLTGARTAWIESVLDELARKSRLPVIGEYDPVFELRSTGLPDKRGYRRMLEEGKVRDVPLWQAIDIVCNRFDLTWDFRDGWLEFRSPHTLLSWAGEADLAPPRYDK